MRCAITLLFTLSPPLVGQVVSPPHFAATEAPASSSTPFGVFGSGMTPFRYAQVHDDVPPMVIHGFAFRHDSEPTGAAQPPFTVTLDAWMSTAAPGITSQSASPTFDNNHGPDRMRVVTNRTVTIAGNDPASVPGPFVLDISFDPGVQFPYAAGGSSLVWEVQLTGRTNLASIDFDAVGVLNNHPTNPQPGRSQAFAGCLATGQTMPVTVTPSAYMNWPGGSGSIGLTAQNLMINSVVIWVSGFDTTQWSGGPLPVVVPGSTSAMSGACFLRTEIADLRATSVSAAGAATLALSVAADPAIHGATVYTQAVGIDPAANPLGFTISNLAIQQFCAPYPTPLSGSQVQLAGGLGPIGFVLPTILVTRFY